MFQTSLPIKFWGESILTATFLINRTPTKVLNRQSPFQVLFGRNPSYNHLRVFGCLYFATNVDPQKSKFQKRAHRCILIGYALTQKAYKLYDLDDHVTMTSRDVLFYEDVFPYALNHPSTPSTIPLPIVPANSDIHIPLIFPNHSSAAVSPIPAKVTHRFCPLKLLPLLSLSALHFRQILHLFIGQTGLFTKAVKYPEWREAMQAEIAALEQSHTWSLTPLPPAKGYNQVEGIDYTDSFSPVAKAVTVRLFLTLAAANGWFLRQLDVNNAFLHGYLDEDLYMSPPDGYPVESGLVCKLERSLYGLKQASRQWNVELTVKLQEYGFSQSPHDHCLFTLSTESGLIGLLVYVDDILLTGPSLIDLQSVKAYLDHLFTIKDIGDARYFLGLEIDRNSSGIYLAQTKYVKDIIKDTGLQQAKSVSTHFPHGLKLSSDSGALLLQPDSYRHLYLKGCPSKGLFLPSDNSLALQAYCDADWASCTDSRRPLTGFCVFLGGALVSWKTKKQSTVSRSTAEAEYRSLAAMVCELKWLSYLLTDFGISPQLPIPLYCDNKAALHILANPVFHERTKHIELDCHLVRDAYKDGFVLPI
ncbi:UNVERIFIED_CONTAM: Retrovirus-related Pol polyprotein from transposon RE2 [Sesamum latifolium]|uniref:Retrovirus-related Pol polyprotein from transposon RE2 n=1 Tax=Sesamum latifolium TaxID=2727402 RepID=A0AAW2WR22_9LAMI